MKIIDGIAYAEENVEQLKVTGVKVLDDYMLIIYFNTNEVRLFDVTNLFEIPVFAPLKESDIYKNPKIVHGILTFNNEKIDIAPETLYEKSYKYDCIKEGDVSYA